MLIFSNTYLNNVIKFCQPFQTTLHYNEVKVNYFFRLVLFIIHRFIYFWN